MSMYDAWVKQETDKIHKDYEKKRQELLEKSMLDGFDNSNQKSEKGQLSTDYEQLKQQEKTAVEELMRQIQSK